MVLSFQLLYLNTLEPCMTPKQEQLLNAALIQLQNMWFSFEKTNIWIGHEYSVYFIMFIQRQFRVRISWEKEEKHP